MTNCKIWCILNFLLFQLDPEALDAYGRAAVQRAHLKHHTLVPEIRAHLRKALTEQRLRCPEPSEASLQKAADFLVEHEESFSHMAQLEDK